MAIAGGLNWEKPFNFRAMTYPWLGHGESIYIVPMSSLRDRIAEIIVEIGELDEPSLLTDEANLFTDLGLDSMQAMEIVLELERQFDIAVDEEELGQIKTLADAVKLASSKGAKS